MPTTKPKLAFSIDIAAPRDVIWDTLIGPETYRDWCSAFNPTCYFEGDWTEGSTVKFLGPDKEGKLGGMIARVLTHRPGEYLLVEHFGVVDGGEELFSGAVYDDWIPAEEDYTLSGGPDTFTLTIRCDVTECYAEFFSKTWPKALARLKELTEDRSR